MEMDDIPPPPPRAQGVSNVKNKAPAKVQITAEQLIREAWERKENAPSAPPKQHIADTEELRDYQRTKRKEFEDRIIRSRAHIPLWLRYAKWEETQNELARARSIFERAIDMDYRTHVLWLQYAEMEMRHRFVNHARNVWDRAVALLPRVGQLWLRYAYMEEMLGRTDLARLVFRRWVEWHPDRSAYAAFVKFEVRNEAVENARGVYELFVRAHPATAVYIKYARFEERQGRIAQARMVYERAAEELPSELLFSALFSTFAKFEERCGEFERARAIYKYAVANLPEQYAKEIGEAYASFEKQRGGTEHIEGVLLEKRRAEYEKAVEDDPRDYDAWFDLAGLEETAGDHARVRAVYNRAQQHRPLAETKRAWKRYVFLWIRHAVWEEMTAEDPQRAADVYRGCLGAIPDGHKLFSFGKVWVLAAEVEVRRGALGSARRILGNALGVLPHKHAIYRRYVAMELALTEVDRARTLYRKWIERNATVSDPYVEFASMEETLGELERARQILEIGVGVQSMDVPEAIWKSYIDMEMRADETDRARALYERLLEVSPNNAVWQSYAGLVKDDAEAAREVYARAHRGLKERMLDAPKDAGARASLAELVEDWVAWERENGDRAGLERVEGLVPTRVKRKRPTTDAADEAGWEEYVEFVFPDERVKKPQLKILDFARSWKARKVAEEGATS